MSENKIPCGGFRIGDGLAMDGDTLKSLGGAYVKVKVNINDGDDEPIAEFMDDSPLTAEFMDDSPLKTYEEIVQKMKTSPVTLLMYSPDGISSLFCNGYLDDLIGFRVLLIIGGQLNHVQVLIHSDNKITLSQSVYTLTPAT